MLMARMAELPPAPRSGRTYLVVVAHPDDADFGVAGTAARLVRDGNQVYYLVLTSGDAGTEDSQQDPEELVRMREEEQDAAGRILGLTGTHYFRLPDGELEPTLALRKRIVRTIRAVQADVVITLDPRTLIASDGRYLNHPDHRAAGQAAVDAAFPGAGNPAAYRDLIAEGLAAYSVKEVWLTFSEKERKNHWVDISETLELKLQALEAHKSQIGDWAENGGLRREITKWAETEAQEYGLPYQAAEGFQRVVIVADETPVEADVVKAETGAPEEAVV